MEPGGRIWTSIFLKNGSNNIVHTSRFRRWRPPIHSSNFFGEIEYGNSEKIGEFPQNSPSNISRTVWATPTNLGNLEQNIDPHLCYFFSEFSDKGLGNAVASKFRKNRRGVNGWPVAGSPSLKTWNFLTGYVWDKARKSSSKAEIFIFYPWGLRCPPKDTPFLGTFGCKPLGKRLIFMKAKLYLCVQRTHVIIFRSVVLKYTQATKSYLNFKKCWKISVKNLDSF